MCKHRLNMCMRSTSTPVVCRKKRLCVCMLYTSILGNKKKVALIHTHMRKNQLRTTIGKRKKGKKEETTYAWKKKNTFLKKLYLREQREDALRVHIFYSVCAPAGPTNWFGCRKKKITLISVFLHLIK